MMKKNSKMQFCKVVLVIFTVIFIICFGCLISIYYQSANAEKEIKELSATMAEIYNTNNTDEKTYPKDCVAWIEIKDTNINYPIMQKEGSPEYYLRRNYKGEYSYSGTPFLDEDCRIVESQNIIVYGHNMKDGTMFSSLTKYKNKQFYEEHPSINLKVKQDLWKYEIVSVNIVNETDEWYSFTDYSNADETNKLINKKIKESLYSTDKTADNSDSFLTLSTCDYSRKNARLIIIAKRSGTNAF